MTDQQFQRIVELHEESTITVEVPYGNRISVTVTTPSGFGIGVELDASEAGELYDNLAAAIKTVEGLK